MFAPASAASAGRHLGEYLPFHIGYQVNCYVSVGGDVYSVGDEHLDELIYLNNSRCYVYVFILDNLVIRPHYARISHPGLPGLCRQVLSLLR